MLPSESPVDPCAGAASATTSAGSGETAQQEPVVASSPGSHAAEGMRQTSVPFVRTHAPPPRQIRALSCVRCQQRKKKCNKKIPCSNCSQVNVACVPSTPAPPRKRKKPTHELTRRLEWCEEQLRLCQRWQQVASLPPELAADAKGVGGS